MSDVALRRALMAVSPGQITDKDQIKNIEETLSACWSCFHGASDSSMQGYKLIDRMEEVSWDPPVLSFKIERHGGTVKGSTRADIHQWVVDIENGTAVRKDAGFRQLYPMDKRFNAKKAAVEVVGLIVSEAEDARLCWSENREIVKIKIGMAVPDGNAQATTTGRRNKFREECEKLLKEQGWKTIDYNKYQKIV